MRATARATSSRAETMTHPTEPTPSGHPDLQASAAPVEAAPPTRRERLYGVLARIGHWSPVLAALVLFAQGSCLGLRPALAEAQRLSDAEVVLTERHERVLATQAEIQQQLAARADPVYRERQRRLRTIRPAQTPPAAGN